MKFLSLISIALLTYLSIKENKDLLFIYSSSFVSIGKKVYISSMEVSNQQYDDFLSEYNNLNLEHLKINNEGWIAGQQFNKSYFIPYQNMYSVSQKYIYHPVVNIRQEAALEYCAYLTRKFNSDPSREFRKVIFRLPTKEEWLKAYKVVKKQEYQGERLGYLPLKEDSVYKANNWSAISFFNSNAFKDNSDQMEYLMNDQYVSVFATWPVFYYQQKVDISIYHLMGNVSEWVQEENIAMGGNWMTSSDAEINKGLMLSSYSPLVGFRVVCEVIQE